MPFRLVYYNFLMVDREFRHYARLDYIFDELKLPKQMSLSITFNYTESKKYILPFRICSISLIIAWSQFILQLMSIERLFWLLMSFAKWTDILVIRCRYVIRVLKNLVCGRKKQLSLTIASREKANI
jgi:hypothetical protein